LACQDKKQAGPGKDHLLDWAATENHRFPAARHPGRAQTRKMELFS